MWNKSLISFIAVAIILDGVTVSVSQESAGILSRKKRFLLFPETTNVIQIIIGIGVPLELKSHSVVFGWGFRAFYNMPSNISELMPMDLNLRKKRAVSRWDIYKTLEKMTDARGLQGRSCILRSICQASDTPVDRYNGFFEELIHTLFTPSTTNEETHHHTDNEYYAAQDLGRRYKGKCEQMFPECEATLLDMFTHILSK